MYQKFDALSNVTDNPEANAKGALTKSYAFQVHTLADTGILKLHGDLPLFRQTR